MFFFQTVTLERTGTRGFLEMAALGLATLGLAACTGGRAPLPDVAGPLVEAVLMSALATADGEPAAPVQPLLLDSISFSRLGAAAGSAPIGHSEIQRQVSRPVTLTDGRSVLVCPDREPCRLENDGVYVEVWEAARSGSDLDIVVTRVQNVRELYVMTRSVTHRILLRQEGGQWRLARRDRLPD